MKNITEALMWRYATKKFDTNKKLNDETLNQILEAGRLSPSSFGLQPWKFILVENTELRAKLREAGYDQAQITEASHVLIIASRNDLSEGYVDNYMKSTALAQNVTVDTLSEFKSYLMNTISSKPNAEVIKNWNARQVYISLGIMLETAALLEVDTCPMEGFENAKYDELLGLNELGYSSVVMLTLGYRDESDESLKRAKSRFGTEEIIIRK